MTGAGIRFSQPLFLLLLLLLPVLGFIHQRRGFHRRSGRAWIGLRLFLLLILILALARPELALPVREREVLFLLDSSQGLPVSERERALEFLESSLLHLDDRDRAGVLAFGADAELKIPPGEVTPASREHLSDELRSVGVDPGQTNIEAALKQGSRLLSGPGRGRLVLLSDGRETAGDARGLIPELVRAGVQVDVLPLNPHEGPEVAVERVVLPERVRAGEEFTIRADLMSSEMAEAELFLYHNGRPDGSREIELEPGLNSVEFSRELSDPGFHRFRVELEAEPDTWTENNRGLGFVVVEGEQRVLMVGGPGDDHPASRHLRDALEVRGIRVDSRPREGFPVELADLGSYDGLILNNTPAETLSPVQMQILSGFVRDLGGGLLITGGPESFGPGGYSGTILGDMLPVRSELEHEAQMPTLSLVLVLDRSGSMGARPRRAEGLTRLDLARLASRAVVDLLLSRERVGVMAFDTEPEWVVPIQEAGNKEGIEEGLDRLSPGGGTSIYPALEEAYNRLREEETAVRHIILLSDGISMPGDFEGISRDMADEGISLSSVAIGDDPDLELLSNLAEWTGGEFYHTADITSFPRILVTEADRIARPALIEDEFRPEPVAETRLTRDVDWASAPPLRGMVATTPREEAEVHLQAPDRSPLLSVWRYGLGRTAAFTSDLRQMWAAGWLEWPEYGGLWGRMVDHILPRGEEAGVTVQTAARDGRGRITVDLVDEEGAFRNFLDLKARVSTPDGDTTSVDLEQTGPGRYAGEFPLEGYGTYMVGIAAGTGSGSGGGDGDGELLKTTGLTHSYSPEFEYRPRPSGLPGELARATGGRVLSDPRELSAPRADGERRPEPVWGHLLIGAAFIFLLDVGTRLVSLRGLRERIGEAAGRAGEFGRSLSRRLEAFRHYGGDG